MSISENGNKFLGRCSARLVGLSVQLQGLSGLFKCANRIGHRVELDRNEADGIALILKNLAREAMCLSEDLDQAEHNDSITEAKGDVRNES